MSFSQKFHLIPKTKLSSNLKKFEEVNRRAQCEKIGKQKKKSTDTVFIFVRERDSTRQARETMIMSQLLLQPHQDYQLNKMLVQEDHRVHQIKLG